MNLEREGRTQLHWTATELENYQLAASKDEELSFEQFPDTFKMSPLIQDAFNTMRILTAQDRFKRERLCLVLIRNGDGAVRLAQEISVAQKMRPNQVGLPSTIEMNESEGEDGEHVIASFHTHPQEAPPSPSDLVGHFIKGADFSFVWKGAISPTYDYVTFRSRNTKVIDVDDMDKEADELNNRVTEAAIIERNAAQQDLTLLRRIAFFFQPTIWLEFVSRQRLPKILEICQENQIVLYRRHVSEKLFKRMV